MTTTSGGYGRVVEGSVEYAQPKGWPVKRALFWLSVVTIAAHVVSSALGIAW